MYSSTLQNSVRRPSAVSRAVSVKKLIEPGSLQSADAELGKDFLLTHAVMKGVQNGIWRFGCGFGFDDGWDRPIGGRHRIGYAASCASGTFWFLPANLCRAARPRQPRRLSGALSPPELAFASAGGAVA